MPASDAPPADIEIGGISYRRPEVGAREAICAFLARLWSPKHLFVEAPDWLDWQHLAPGEDRYDIVVAAIGGEIAGLLGVMPLGRGPDAGVATGIWAADAERDKRIGLNLFRALDALYAPAFIGSLGVNASARMVLGMLGHKSGVSRHYYLASPRGGAGGLASGLRTGPSDAAAGAQLRIEETSEAALRSGENPTRPAAWFRERYAGAAPYPDYRFLALATPGGVDVSTLIARPVETDRGRCLRIVDATGLDFATHGRIDDALGALLADEGFDYADFLIGGPAQDAFAATGLRLREEDVVLPNYFDPFLAQNVDLGWTIRSDDPNALVTRGMTDQDRPNRPRPAPTRA